MKPLVSAEPLKSGVPKWAKLPGTDDAPKILIWARVGGGGFADGGKRGQNSYPSGLECSLLRKSAVLSSKKKVWFSKTHTKRLILKDNPCKNHTKTYVLNLNLMISAGCTFLAGGCARFRPLILVLGCFFPVASFFWHETLAFNTKPENGRFVMVLRFFATFSTFPNPCK